MMATLRSGPSIEPSPTLTESRVEQMRHQHAPYRSEQSPIPSSARELASLVAKVWGVMVQMNAPRRVRVPSK